MAIERVDTTGGHAAKAAKAHKFLGSLRDALMAAGRDEAAADTAKTAAAAAQASPVSAPSAAMPRNAAGQDKGPAPLTVKAHSPSAEEAARLARTSPAEKIPDSDSTPAAAIAPEPEEPPTTRVVRPEASKARKAEPEAPRTVLVRGRQKIEHGAFERDPVVGFLIVVGGPGLGSFRPIFEGNNTVGRSAENRIPFDFGDDAISNEAQAYVRYDSSDRSFLFVPNLAKTNVVSVNDKRPAGPVPLQPMDVITLGRTQVAFLPFCGSDFDWSEISEA